MKVNKYGLPRKIDFLTKRILRQECGYGCVICGNAIYQYEHIDPEYSEAKVHDPIAMALLCGACHDKVTRGIWSKRKVKEARVNPICKKRGFSNFALDTTTSNDFIIKIGKTSFLNLESVIEIDDKIILSILPPEEFNSPPRISAIFFDRNNNQIACIDENEWVGFTGTFDIETKGNSIVIRSNDRKIDLIVKLESPDLLILEKIEMMYNNIRISGSYNSDFKVYTKNSGLKIPQTKTQIKNAPFWLSVKGDKISLGSESIIKFTSLNGKEVNLPGYYDIENLGLELGEINEKTGQRSLRFNSVKTAGKVVINFNLPKSELKIKPVQLQWDNKTPDFNEPCSCNSNKSFKECCLQNYKELNKILSSTKIQYLTDKISQLYKTDKIRYQFDFNLDGHISFDPEPQIPFIIINSKSGNNESNLAFALSCGIKIKEGFPTVLKGVYFDRRHTVIAELGNNMLHIPVIEKMSKMKFNIESFIRPTLLAVYNGLSARQITEVQNVPILRIHYEAAIYLRINYEAMFLSKKERENFDNLFQLKAPISLSLGLEMIDIINKSNPYTPTGNTLAFYNCIQLLNIRDFSKTVFAFSFNQYSEYLQCMKRKYPFIN